MKVGDYVRTEEGIKRVGNYYYKDAYDNGHCIYFEGDNFGLLFTDDEYKNMKSSPNIIDLIEVGDYVNGSKVIDIAQAPKRAIYIEDIQQHLALIPITNISRVVTKEQFESMEYKVGE